MGWKPLWATTMQLSEGVYQAGVLSAHLGGDGGQRFSAGPGQKSLPMGTAYAVWTGDRRPGGGDCGHRFLQRAYQRRADLFATLLLVGIVGLKATSH